MALLSARLGDAYDRHSGYVYLLASRMHRAVYVGETNDAGGAIGRAGSHLRPNGTFTERFEDRIGLPAEAAADLTLLCARLPLTAEYTSVETSYRRGVEYLVQDGLLRHPLRKAERYDLIARVAYSPRAELAEVRQIADEIVRDFATHYPTLA